MQSFGSQSPEQLVSDGVIVSVTPTDGAITGDAATAGAEGEDVVMCCSSDSADQSPPEACCEECPSTEEDCEDCSLRACCPELFPPSYVRHGVYFAGMRELTATEDGMRYDFLAQQLYLIRGVSIAGLDVPSNHPVESLAFSAVAHGQISWHQLERMVQQLPCDRNLRWPQEQSHQLAPRRFTCGAWNHGPHTGLTTTTRVFPWCTRVLAGVVSTWDSQLLFSTCTLSLNVAAAPHKDRFNHAQTVNLAMPCSSFRGGELFVEHSEGRSRLSQDGPSGHVLDLSLPVVFSPKALHATLPWSGTRLILISYHIGQSGRLCSRDLFLLRVAGFQPGHTGDL